MEVTDATNKNLIGITGKIIDETKNTITVEQQDIKKKLIKEQITFTIHQNNTRIKIDGKKITKKTEKRN